MLTVFYIAAAIMIAATLAVILLPLLRSGRLHGRPKGVFALCLALVFVLPLSTIGIYALVGDPGALQPSVVQTLPNGMSVNEAVARLKKDLDQSPNNLQGWLLLAQTYDTMQQPAKARDAYAHALKLAPGSADIMVAWVGASSLAQPQHLIDGKMRARLQQALGIEPHNQRGLWLLGISDYQAGHFTEAMNTWHQLENLLAPGSDVAGAVKHQIAMAKARAAGKTQAEAEQMLQPGATRTTIQAPLKAPSPQIEVRVRLSPALKSKVTADDTLYVYAHAVGDAATPLAVAQLKASTLPVTVRLTDAMSMLPGHDLSSVGKVLLTARISRDGKAMPHPGDLEGSVGPLPVSANASASILINKTL